MLYTYLYLQIPPNNFFKVREAKWSVFGGSSAVFCLFCVLFLACSMDTPNMSAISSHGYRKYFFVAFANNSFLSQNRPFSYSTKEPGSNDIFIQFYTRGLIEWRWRFDCNCAPSKILQIVMKYRSIHIRFQNS